MNNKFLHIFVAAWSFITGFCYATISFVPFNAQNDMHAVTTLIKAEWHKLFFQPDYDPIMINKMLLHNKPGNYKHPDKKLYTLVVKNDETFVGFVTYYYVTPTIGHIELLAVDKKFRAQGIGKKIIEYTMAILAEKGAQTIQLYVYKTNPKAIEFYSHLGFKTVYSEFPDCLLLSKPIK